MKFLVLKKRTLFIYSILIIALICINCFCFVANTNASSPIYKYSIVIDAGHGGADGGSVGRYIKNDENHLNLDYAKTLMQYFTAMDIKVVLTRTSLDGLYGMFSKNKKKDDMLARKNIIDKSNADIVLSVHMNSFPLGSSRGAQVFYKKNCEVGFSLAKSIQNQFIKDLPNARKTCQTGDYYILNCSSVPSVIIECGFLSNMEEEKLLNTEVYKNKVCYSIMCGVLNYLGYKN